MKISEIITDKYKLRIPPTVYYDLLGDVVEAEDEQYKDIKAEIEQVKAVMNEEIIEHNRKDLINFVNGLNQCLVIVDKHISGKEEE